MRAGLDRMPAKARRKIFQAWQAPYGPTSVQAGEVEAVAERTGELGVRMALGAASRDILRLVVLEGMRPVGLGIALGLAAAGRETDFISGIAVQFAGVGPAEHALLATGKGFLVLGIHGVVPPLAFMVKHHS